jgi:hypothetical protein
VSGLPILNPEQRWACPNCPAEGVTHEAAPHTRFHTCAGLKGLTAPMVPAGIRCKVVAHEREDYIAGDDVQTDAEGRPVMSVVTTRDDGEDVTVYAPCARARGVSLMR